MQTLMLFRKQNKELERFADLLIEGTVALFKERGDIHFSSLPQKKRRRIIEYQGRMRADGMDKFNNQPTYVAAVNFYLNAKDLENEKAVGALIVYVEQSYIATLMRLLEYPAINDESEQAMLDSAGTLCNILAGRFKSEISAAGYVELEMSHFINYRNSAIAGIDFCFHEFDLYEISFDIKDEKRLVMEMTIGHLPSR